MHAPRLVKLQLRTGHGSAVTGLPSKPVPHPPCAPRGAKYKPAATGSTALRSRRVLSLKLVAINPPLVAQARGPGLTRQPSDRPSGPLHPMRVKTQSARVVCPADSPIVGWRVDRRNLELNELNALNEAWSLAVRAGKVPTWSPVGPGSDPGYGRKGSCPGWSNAWSTKMMPPSKRPEAIESTSAQPVSPARRPATPPHTPSESTPVRTITWMIRV
jgi:hypothetical protein